MIKEEIVFEETQVIEQEDYTIERNKPMPNRIHSTIQQNVSFQLQLSYGDKYDVRPEVSLNMKPGATPDICIFSKKKLDWRTTPAKEQDVPITTIEILSPSQSLDDLALKVWEQYFPWGVQSAWVVVPPPFKSVYVITPEGKKHFDAGTLTDPVTGVELPLEKIFDGLV